MFETKKFKFSDLLVFVLIGLVFASAPEFLEQVLVRSSWSVYLTVLAIDAVQLTIWFLIWKLITKLTKDFSRAKKIYFLATTAFGFLFEWFFLGNHPFSSAIQLAMLAYSSNLFMLPIALTVGSKKVSGRFALITCALLQVVSYVLLFFFKVKSLEISTLILTITIFILWWWTLGETFDWPAKANQRSVKIYYGVLILILTFLELVIPKPFGVLSIPIFFLFFWRWIRKK